MTPIRTLGRDRPAAAVLLGGAIGMLALAAGLRLGPAGLLAPVAAVTAIALLLRPGLALTTLLALVVVCESRDASLLPALEAFYTPLAGPVAAVDLLVLLAVAATALELSRREQPVRLPSLLTLPLALVGLAALAGAITGLARGGDSGVVLLALRPFAFLAVLPVLVVNLLQTRRDVTIALGFGLALAAAKAVLGLMTVATGRGRAVEGSVITFYEPVANWLMLVALLGMLAALLLGTRDRVPLWALLAAPLMIASLGLSLRRSFWIGLALGVLLVVVLGASPLGRRMLVPAGALIVAGLWALGSVGFQTQGPLTERLETLAPSRIEANAEDRYRLDERANVLAELRAHPIAGLGMGVEWSSAEQALPVEHDNGRDYVHMVTLWYWLKLGLVGLAGYTALMGAAGLMAWRSWRRHPDRLLRAAGLAAVCSLTALAAIETTGSFTAVEPRFTIVFGAMLGLLAVIYRSAADASA